MPIRIHNFGGRLGWNARKYLPRLSSESYLKLQFITRGKSQKKYIDYFMNKEEIPKPNIVNLETINRCNSTCEFCTANKNAEKRPYKRMEEELGIPQESCEIEELFSFNYFSQYDGLSEYEIDHVFLTDYHGEIKVDTDEIMELRWVSLEDLQKELEDAPQTFSTWFLIAAPRVMEYIARK